MLYSTFEPCERCQRVTPRTKRGDCVKCRARLRRAKRKAKAVATGSNLERHGQLMEIADNLWSVWVRAAAAGCELCGVPFHPRDLQWAHGYTRRKLRIRYHLDNGFALCPADHRRHTPPGPEWYEWMQQHLGVDRFRALSLCASAGPKLTTSVLHLVMLDARQRIAALPETERKEWARVREAVILEDFVRLGVRAA